MRITKHLLEGATQRPSDHSEPRPGGQAPDTLVIHCISLPPGTFGTGHIADLFTGRLAVDADRYFKQLDGLKVSAHLLIERNGDITQFVPFDRCAWHAGLSRLGDREGVNDFSIGIELEGLPEIDFELAQYAALASVTRTVLATYPQVDVKRIVGHCDIAPGRKNDPGTAFDWGRYFREAGLLPA